MNSNRRMKKAVNELGGKMDSMMQTPCSITEAVQIARGVAEDVVTDYHRTQGNVQLSMTIQLELLRNVVISAGLITEEEFRQRYADKVKEIQKLQENMTASASKEDNGVTEMKVDAGEVEVKVEN